MRCNFCGAEWTLPYKATFEDCPFCLRPLGKASQNHHTSGNPLSDFDIVGTVLRAYKGTNPVVVVPDGITELKSIVLNEGTFAGNTVVQKVVLPSSVSRITRGAFYECVSLREVVLPDSITEIPNQAFMGCTSLNKIVLPKGLKRIGIQAFSGCTALTEVVIPEGVEELGAYSFAGCCYLNKIVIPNSIKSIGLDDKPFFGCTALKNVECPERLLKYRFFEGSFLAEELSRRDKLEMENRRKIASGICPKCEGVLSFFKGQCKTCGSRFK